LRAYVYAGAQRAALPPPMSYDRRVFAMTGNDPAGDCAAGTLFHYRQQGLRVWATYGGGDVRLGALVAQADPRGHLCATYLHVAPGGTVRTGACQTTPELLLDRAPPIIGELALAATRAACGRAARGIGYMSILEELAAPAQRARIVADPAQIV
jgi:hypothetical protein